MLFPSIDGYSTQGVSAEWNISRAIFLRGYREGEDCLSIIIAYLFGTRQSNVVSVLSYGYD